MLLGNTWKSLATIWLIWFSCSPFLIFYHDYYYYFLDLKYDKTKSFIPPQFSCTLSNHYLYFKILLYVRCLWIEITVTSCMCPSLDSDVKCVEGEKQRVRMLSQTPRYVRISNRIYPTKSIPQTSRIPHRENNAPQNRGGGGGRGEGVTMASSSLPSAA